MDLPRRTRMVAFVVLLVLAGCGLVTQSDREAAPQPGEATPVGTALKGIPEPGQCRNTLKENVDDNEDWLDDAPVVPCGKKHVTETVTVFELPDPTPQAALAFAELCQREVVDYIGLPSGTPVSFDAHMYLPSQKQVAAGHSWVRCDVLMWADSGSNRPAVRTSSMKDGVAKDPAAYWTCAKWIPKPNGGTSLVSCKLPHRAELTPTQLVLTDLKDFPTPDILAGEGTRQCRAGMTDRWASPGLTVEARWDDKLSENELTGKCWVTRLDGKAIPPMS